MAECRQFTPDRHSEGSEESVVRWCKADSSARTSGLGTTSISLVRRTCNCFQTEPRPMPSRIGRGLAVDLLEMAGMSADYETNPIVRQASREAVLPPNFHGLALPAAGKAGPGAGFRGDRESSRPGDFSAADGAGK